MSSEEEVEEPRCDCCGNLATISVIVVKKVPCKHSISKDMEIYVNKFFCDEHLKEFKESNNNE